MTISLKSEASGKPNLDLVFDPYYEGTKPPATGLLDDSGSDIVNRYAPIVYGSQALATGLLTKQSGNADINTLFAAYGTANYALPINNVTITANCAVTSPSLTANCTLRIISTSTTWQALATTTTSGGTTSLTTFPSSVTSGSVPPGAAYVKYSYIDQGGSGTVSVYNGAATMTALSGTIEADFTNVKASGLAGVTHDWTITIVYYNASGIAISTTSSPLQVSCTS